MRIIHLIGNGFDINHGIKTRYPDFYQYYRAVHSDNSIINKLKEEIANDHVNWSDMEFAFGKHTSKITSLEELDLIVTDIAKNLGEYLKKQEDKFDFSKVNKRKIHEYLANPENVLLPADKNQITKFKNNFKNLTWTTDIVTFNYTKVLEEMLGNEFKNINIGNHHNGLSNTLRSIDHIHGYTNRRLIFGLNDISQVENEEFHNNQDIFELIIKSAANQASRTTIDQRVITRIKQANLICLFGSSIGETDKCWWELIGECLKKDIRLIIYDIDPLIDELLPQKKMRTERKIIEKFLIKTNLSKEEKNLARNRIFIGLNTDMFSDVYL
ncbi:AbiH family protein [Psychroserpens mesophilus]|uniref:AbiH family protein n=1 Tax=Psychroserpens mesophilus TaxID=325473 RepID=UPI0005915B1A|nr:AbiH family protein [Psychroserpens mesophilus]